MRGFGTILHLTLHEAMRRRVLLASLAGGAAFLVLFGIALHFMDRSMQKGAMALVERRMALNLFTLAGLFAVNFLAVMSAVLLPVDTLAGEIGSGVMQTLASKPIRRSTILLGKWAAYVLLLAGYIAVMGGGVLLLARVFVHLTVPNVAQGLPLMALESALLVTLSILGGTRFSTVTNGVVVMGLYGLAFIGNWAEQIGALVGNDTARSLGTLVSLFVPADAMWQLAASRMQPPLTQQLHNSPFSPFSVPSPAMVVWTVGYVLVALLAAVALFRRRPL
jgi:Cu-processing system permease protein